MLRGYFFFFFFKLFNEPEHLQSQLEVPPAQEIYVLKKTSMLVAFKLAKFGSRGDHITPKLPRQILVVVLKRKFLSRSGFKPRPSLAQYAELPNVTIFRLIDLSRFQIFPYLISEPSWPTVISYPCGGRCTVYLDIN